MTKKYQIYWRSVVHITPLSLEWLQCVPVKPSMPSTKVINLRRTSHRSVPHSAPTAPAHCPAWNAICKGCSKKVTGMPNATVLVLPANSPLNPMELRGSHHQCHRKGKRANIVQVSTEETPPCDELFINAVNCGTTGDTHPEDIVVDNVHTLQCNEAYTMVQLHASTSSKGTVSLHVKVDTRAGGNMLPFCVF